MYKTECLGDQCIDFWQLSDQYQLTGVDQCGIVLKGYIRQIKCVKNAIVYIYASKVPWGFGTLCTVCVCVCVLLVGFSLLFIYIE